MSKAHIPIVGVKARYCSVVFIQNVRHGMVAYCLAGHLIVAEDLCEVMHKAWVSDVFKKRIQPVHQRIAFLPKR